MTGVLVKVVLGQFHMFEQNLFQIQTVLKTFCDTPRSSVALLTYPFKLTSVAHGIGQACSTPFHWNCHVKLMRVIGTVNYVNWQYSRMLQFWEVLVQDTVDGRNPAPPVIHMKPLWNMWDSPYQLISRWLAGFLSHQQYFEWITKEWAKI